MLEKFQPEFRIKIESVLNDYLEGKINDENLEHILRSEFNLNEGNIKKILDKAKFSKSRRQFIKNSITTIISSILNNLPIKEDKSLKRSSIYGTQPVVASLPTPEIKKLTTKVIYRGPASTKKVAVTFDDRPSPVFLNKLLEFAKTNKVKMVWFNIGRTTSREAAEIIKEGLGSGLIRIGNHTMNHRIDLFANLSNLEQVKQEIELWIEKMQNYGLPENELLRYFRPPGGGGGYRGGNPILLSILSEIGYSYLCMWDTEFIYTTRVNKLKYNFENIRSIMTNNILRTRGGNLVLCHFNNVDVIASLQVINNLLKQGYTFVFPEELFD